MASEQTRSRGLPAARIALIVAALIALGAVALALFRNRAEAPIASPTPQATTEPSVEQMVSTLENRLKQNPGDAEGWRMLGWAYYRMERFKDAVGAYRRAVVADPKNADGWSALGEAIALAQGDATVPAEAVAAFNRALAIDKADPRARYFLGVKKDLDGDHKGAIDDWLALLKDTPPGAPWEANVRQTVRMAAEKNKIDISGRLPAPKASAQASDNVATAAIPGPTPEQLAAASSIPPSQQDEMVKGMVARLAGRLKENPKDADGWIRLMRARMVLNDPGAARQALTEARAAFNGDAAAQARLATAAKTLGVPGS